MSSFSFWPFRLFRQNELVNMVDSVVGLFVFVVVGLFGVVAAPIDAK